MPAAPSHDWFLPQWLQTLDMKQTRLLDLTGWDKRKTSQLMSGKQRYNRETINDAAHALNLQPYELLMHPDDAMAIRRLRTDAVRIASDTRTPLAEVKTGTNG